MCQQKCLFKAVPICIIFSCAAKRQNNALCSGGHLRVMKNGQLSMTANSLPTLKLFSCGQGYECDMVSETCDAKEPAEKYLCASAEKEYQSWFQSQGESNTCDHYDWVRQCNPQGQYSKIQAKTSPFTEEKDARRFCTDPKGNRIFGDAPIDPEDTEVFDINCKCSRKIWELKQTIYGENGETLMEGRTDVTLHCQKYGNFEELQCDQGRCWCVDPGTGKVSSVVVHHELAKLLRCYNHKTFGHQYLRRCESRTHGRAVSNKILRNHGLIWSQKEDYSCDPDGSFAPVNCKKDQIKCGCVDKYNSWIKSYNDADNLKHEFNCICARDEASNPQLGLYCDKRGNYAAIQQFVSPAPGKEFCVDKDGFQETPKYVINGGPTGKKCSISNCKARFYECNNVNADGTSEDNGQCEECKSTCY